MRRRSLRILLVLLVLVALILIYLWRRGDNPHRGPAPKAFSPTESSERPRNYRRPTPLPLPNQGLVAGAPPIPDPPPIIDDIKVEKTEVCEGEENLITVAAHTANKTDEQLHYVIAGQMGSSVPVQVWKNEHGVAADQVIQVFGRGNVVTTVPMPRYTVKQCRVERYVTIKHRVRPNSWAEFQFRADVIRPLVNPPKGASKDWRPPPLKEFVPVKFDWSFGDGETTSTSIPVADHSYEFRSQDTLYSYFVIKVDVTGADGEVYSGRTSLPLINPAFEALYTKGKVALFFAFTPRFPEMTATGTVTQKVRVWHTRPQAISVERVRVTRTMTNGEQLKPEELSPGSLLGTSSIPPGRGVLTDVSLDTNAEPDVMMLTYMIEGTSDEGWPVTGTFSLMRPPPNPTRENSRPVMDPLLKEKIIRARQILGKDVVSDEDIWQLQREGAFSDLTPPEASGPTGEEGPRVPVERRGPRPAGMQPGGPQPGAPQPTGPQPGGGQPGGQQKEPSQ